MTNCKSLQRKWEGVIPPLPPDAVLPAGLGDDACVWLDKFEQFCSTWSPRSFEGYHDAIGLFVLSTAARRRVAYNMGRLRYTNLYIALIGRTSLHAKTTDAEIGVSFLHACGLADNLLPDTTTPQKMVSLMSSNLPVDFEQMSLDKKKKILMTLAFAGQKGWMYDEFGDHFSEMMRSSGPMAEFRSLLRRLDDSREDYRNSTIIRGDEVIVRPYLSLLACLTKADIAAFVRQGSLLWGDGYLARFFLVCPPEGEYKNGRFPTGNREFPADLISEIVNWHNRLGIPKIDLEKTTDFVVPTPPTTILNIDPDAMDAFYRYDHALRDIMADLENEDLDGNYARFAEKAMRIAALFASLNNEQVIRINHWAKAQEITERFRGYLHNLYQQVVAHDDVSAKKDDRVLEIISEWDGITRREIQQYAHIEAEIAKPILKRLMHSGLIVDRKVGNTIKYFPTDINKRYLDELNRDFDLGFDENGVCIIPE